MVEHDDLTDNDAALLATALIEQRPPAHRAHALKARILREAAGIEQATQTASTLTVRSEERIWEQRPFGLEVCTLHEDARTRAVLVRMAPGAMLPPHDHEMDEESLILEGDAMIGEDIYLQAGDYHFARAGVRHPTISSPNGCIVYVYGDRKMPLRMTPGFLRKLIRFLLPRKGGDRGTSTKR